MKQRILVAAVGVPLLLVIFLVLPPWATAVLTAAIAVIACYELIQTAAPDCPAFVRGGCMVSACIVAVSGLPGGTAWVLAPSWALLMILCFVCVRSYGRKEALRFASLCVAFFGGAVFPLMYSCIVRLRLFGGAGKTLVLVPFVIAFLGDTFSMLGGMVLGKRKLAPLVSPNKTWAGFLAGPVGSAVGMILLALISARFGIRIPILNAAILGAFANLFGQLGDLTTSLIKREAGVKDYSRLFLEHGGMLDRFDSTLFISPVVFMAVSMGFLGGLI